MPRAFDETERETVRTALLDAGTALLGRYGIAKTGVDDIVRDAGVAKGTFYAFWPSKDAFVFACMERIEEQIQADVIGPELAEAADPADAIGRMFVRTLDLIADYPLLRDFLDPDVIRRLARGVPPEMMAAHVEKDSRETAAMMEGWKAVGFDPGIPPEVFDGLYKGLMMMSLHRKIIGDAVFPRAIETLGRILTAGLRSLDAERKEENRR
jgi:AcrR family transcriptional regulator